MTPISELSAHQNSHLHPHRVRFGECDPAGVVYFPRFFDWFHQAMESWFDGPLGWPYFEVLQQMGFPSVRSEADFRRPCFMGEDLQIELSVGTIGRSSFQLNYRVLGPDGVTRATGQTVCATIRNAPGQEGHFQPMAMPDELRERILRFQEESNV